MIKIQPQQQIKIVLHIYTAALQKELDVLIRLPHVINITEQKVNVHNSLDMLILCKQ